MRKPFLPALILLSGMYALPLLADDITKLKIVVTNADGKPVDRANVIVRFGGRSIKKLGRTVHTQWEMRATQEGVADIPDMPKGKIRVQVTAKGFQTFGNTFEVNEDQRTIEVKLNPPQQQYSAHENN